MRNSRHLKISVVGFKEAGRIKKNENMLKSFFMGNFKEISSNNIKN